MREAGDDPPPDWSPRAPATALAVLVTIGAVWFLLPEKTSTHATSIARKHGAGKSPSTAIASPRNDHGSQQPQQLCLGGHVLPAIQLIGVQKGGTSSLHADLVKYIPAVVEAVNAHHAEFRHEHAYFRKELHFFGNSKRFKKGLEFYARHYQRCPGQQQQQQHGARAPPVVIGIDATPHYIRRVEVPAQMRDAFLPFPGAPRIVVVLRDPVDRAQSWFNMFGPKHVAIDAWAAGRLAAAAKHCGGGPPEALRLARNATSPACDDWIARTTAGQGPIVAGLYARQLRRWLAAFPAAQLAVASFTGYTARPRAVLADLGRFVTGDAAFALPNKKVHAAHKNRHPARRPQALSDATRRRLRRLYAGPNRELLALVRAAGARGLLTTPVRHVKSVDDLF